MSDSFYYKFRYRGKLENPKEIYNFISEVEDICKSNNWEYRVWDENWEEPSSLTLTPTAESLSFGGHAPLKGISFSVGESENIWLTFMPDGMLQSLFTLTNPTFFLDDPDFPWQRTKTGYDRPEIIIPMYKLLHYLEEKYFAVFEVTEESEYWEHKDDQRYIDWMNRVKRNELIRNQELALLEEDTSLTQEERTKRFYEIIKKYGRRDGKIV